jgi:adenosine kinase
VPGAAYLLGNEYELAMIQDKTGWSQAEIIAQVGTLVQTLGKRGSMLYHNGREIAIPAAGLAAIQDPTGAGDAYRGGFFAGVLAGLPLAVCGRAGALCSAYSLEQTGTTAHRFSLTEFVARYEATFGPEPALAKLNTTAQPGAAQLGTAHVTAAQ